MQSLQFKVPQLVLTVTSTPGHPDCLPLKGNGGTASTFPRAPDGVHVRVELLHSRSQEFKQPLGEKVAARGPRHWRPCPGHRGGTGPRHLQGLDART